MIELSQIVGLLFPLVIGFVAWAAKKWVEQVVANMEIKMEARTQPIQPGANGGYSLPDAIRILKKLDGNVDQLKIDMAHLRGRFDQHITEGDNNA